jgi:hypothetical protein
MSRHIDVEQGTDEWLSARLGVPTASNFAKFLSPTGKPSTQADSYVNQLVAEKLTGERTAIFKSDDMQRGNDLEPQAKAMYEFIREVEVKEMGLMLHDDFDAGCSPDGLVGCDGGIEIKCPRAENHIANLRRGTVDMKYYPQIQGCLWITEREWWDFVSFHPELEILIVRVERNEEYINKLAGIVEAACKTITLEADKWRKI